MRRLRALDKFWLATGTLLGSTHLMAQPVLETIDRFELNWSSMRIRFYGESETDFAKSGFEGGEKAATEEGLLYALSRVGKVRQSKGLAVNQPATDVAHELTKQAYVFNTTYFADGRVRVDLEGMLPRALDPQLANFPLDDPESTPSEGTAIVLQLSEALSPRQGIEVVGPQGEKLYSPKDVARSAFKKNLTGRWFYQNSSELRSFGGAKPIVVEASAAGERIVVDREQWLKIKAEHPRLIEEAKVGFALPALAKNPRRPSL